MKFSNPYFSNVTKIELLQQWILVHSVLYYEHDVSFVSDHTYDLNSQQLAKLMREFPQDAKLSKYAYCFRHFDGSTGFDLPKKLRPVDRRHINWCARNVISICELKTEERQ